MSLLPRQLLHAVLGAVLGAGIASSAHAQQTGAIAGTVRDSAGKPIVDALLEVGPPGLRTRSLESGRYRIGGLPAGEVILSARRLGYKPVSVQVFLRTGEEQQLDVILTAAAEMLAPMEATARPEVYESRLAGFNARSTKKVGHFVTRDRIDRANSTTLSDMLREIPGVKIGPVRNQGRAIRLRGASCPPLVFVDGFPASAAEFDVDIIDLASVEGIEVYSGLASIPPEFSGPRDLDRCGVIGIWSRPSRARIFPANVQLAAARDTLPVDEDEPRTMDRVDQIASLDSGASPLHYPDSLFQAKVSGRVVVEFIVGTRGAVEPASIDVLSSTNESFTRAVRDALLVWHFKPAVQGGRRVRQYMQLPFSFSPPERD